MEVEKTSKGSIETNIDPRLQGPGGKNARLIEELIEVQVDPSDPSRVVKIGKGLKMN